MKGFTDWMSAQNHAVDTISTYEKYAKEFIRWLTNKSLIINNINYNMMMDYITLLRKKDSVGLTNVKLGAIRKYYDYLQHENITGKNPATGIYLKGKRKVIPHDLLDREALDKLYEGYHIIDERTQRNKVMLGLLICQGLTTGELHRLEPIHLKLRSGKIDIPAGSKSRALALQPDQILDLQEYMTKTRPLLLSRINRGNTHHRGRKPDKLHKRRLHNQLFMSMNGSENLKNSLKHLFMALKQLNPDVKNASQIRQSVITEWLKVKDLRTVQYMAGHRYVSTTERYRTQHLEALQEQLNQHHPLK